MFTLKPVAYDFACSSGSDSMMSAARRQARTAFHANYASTPAGAIASLGMKAARQVLYRPASSCGRAHRRFEIQPRAIPETGRGIAGIRIRLCRARPDVAHLGADKTGGGSGGSREAPSPVHRPSPAVAL